MLKAELMLRTTSVNQGNGTGLRLVFVCFWANVEVTARTLCYSLPYARQSQGKCIGRARDHSYGVKTKGFTGSTLYDAPKPFKPFTGLGGKTPQIPERRNLKMQPRKGSLLQGMARNVMFAAECADI